MDPTSPHAEFLALYRPVHERLVKYCSSNGYGIIDTDDLVQETVLATMQQFSRIREKEKLLSYMISVANHVVYNALRRKKFNGAYNEKAFERLKAVTADPDIALDMHHLYVALNKLPVRDKEAILLFEISGYSIQEIAGIQNSSEGAIKTRLSRARKKLTELFSGEFQQKKSPAGIAQLFLMMM